MVKIIKGDTMPVVPIRKQTKWEIKEQKRRALIKPKDVQRNVFPVDAYRIPKDKQGMGGFKRKKII